MKKLFSLVFVLTFVALLSACQSNDYETKIEDLETKITQLEQAQSTMETSLAQYQNSLAELTTVTAEAEAEVQGLLDRIETLESLQYDGMFLVTFESETIYETHQINYRDDDDLTVLDYLIATFEMDYSESDFGVFINAIGPLNTQHGNFISISQNQESLMVGIDQVSFEDGDHFSFALSWWDDEAKLYHDQIQLFIDEHAESFIESQNEYVLTGLSHVMTRDTVEQEMETQTNPLIKQILALKAQGQDVTAHQAALNDQLTYAHPYAASLAVFALHDYEDFDATDFIDLVKSEDLEALDLDTLSLIAVALDILGEEPDLLNSIKTHLTENAFNHPYGQNSATFANVIIALIALDVDPRTIEEDGQNLMETLLAYQLEDGSFKYTLDDDSADLMFSTPQSFLALISMQAYLAQGAFNPYNIK